MTTEISLVAAKLLERRSSTQKFARLSEEYRPNTIDEALAIQAQMSVQNDSAIAGWKCLLPPDTDKVVVAPIYQNTVYQGDVAKFHMDNGVARIEPEIVFILAGDLPAQDTDYTEAEIDAAIGSTHMALELIQSRFADNSQASFIEMLADGLSNQGLFIGPEIDKAAVYKAKEITINIEQASNSKSLQGQHPNPLPQQPIYWLVNYMSKRGITFKAGQKIITGSYAGVVDLAFNEATTVEYKGLGSYSVTLEQLA